MLRNKQYLWYWAVKILHDLSFLSSSGWISSLWFLPSLSLKHFKNSNRQTSLRTPTAAAVCRCDHRCRVSQLTVSLGNQAAYQTVPRVEPASQRLSAQAQTRLEEKVVWTRLPAVEVWQYTQKYCVYKKNVVLFSLFIWLSPSVTFF